MKNENISIEVENGGRVSAVVSIPAQYSGQTGIIFAHGAGNDMNHPLILYLAENLAEHGYLTLRFNFPYREQGRKSPDSQRVLGSTWLHVVQFLQQHHLRPKRIIAAGKSLGGRVASQLAAEGKLSAERLILLGYPLHAPGSKDKLRDSHLYEIDLPMLFFAGTRDPLCDLDLLRVVLSRLKTARDLEVIDGGDHSFNLPKSHRKSKSEVNLHILDRMMEWLKDD